MPVTRWIKNGVVYEMVEASTKEKIEYIKNNTLLGCMVDDDKKTIYYIKGVFYNPREAGLVKV